MLAHESNKSHILITHEMELEASSMQERFKPFRTILFIEDTFKLEHAKAVVAEAYISESQTKYIIFGAKKFTAEAQNSLLKILEEPPKNIEFIILSPTKSNLLPTIRSRLPLINKTKSSQKKDIDLNLAKLDFQEVFRFLKEHERVPKDEAKEIVEALYFRASVKDKLIISENQLQNFDKAYRLLELNSRPNSVLALILMGFLHEN